MAARLPSTQLTVTRVLRDGFLTHANLRVNVSWRKKFRAFKTRANMRGAPTGGGCSGFAHLLDGTAAQDI
ncbi:MAG: hypothetical protein LH624_12545 [Cryobacterium sp.]|nr:hypothetical protein [Cryobacterium sp.]